MRGVWGIFDRAVTNMWILPTPNFRITEVHLYTYLWRGAVLVETVRPETGYANTVLSFEHSVAGQIPVPRVFIGVLSGLIQAVLSVLPTLRIVSFRVHIKIILLCVCDVLAQVDLREAVAMQVEIFLFNFRLDREVFT